MTLTGTERQVELESFGRQRLVNIYRHHYPDADMPDAAMTADELIRRIRTHEARIEAKIEADRRRYEIK